jgi:hypothetical protein
VAHWNFVQEVEVRRFSLLARCQKGNKAANRPGCVFHGWEASVKLSGFSTHNYSLNRILSSFPSLLNGRISKKSHQSVQRFTNRTSGPLQLHSVGTLCSLYTLSPDHGISSASGARVLATWVRTLQKHSAQQYSILPWPLCYRTALHLSGNHL